VTDIILTQYDGVILGPIARVLGVIMNLTYLLMSKLGVNNIGLSIILLTIIIYTCMLPLTYKQQKFSFVSRKMNPELKAIQAKYKGKKDQDSLMAQNEETRAIYDKYGVSPSGSCIQIAIQMPILFALYRVIGNVPAYVSSVKDIFTPLSSAIMGQSGYADKMTELLSSQTALRGSKIDFAIEDTAKLSNYIIDVLYKMNDAGWDFLSENFSGISSTIVSVKEELTHINYFLGLNIGYTPWNLIRQGFTEKHFLLMFGAALIPVISYFTQVLNIKLMPQPENPDPNDQMAQQMKTMNKTMPLFSLVMCFTVPVGLGLYWIASALIRCIQQFAFNKYLSGLDFDELVAKNVEKAKAKAEKRRKMAGMDIYRSANVNTKNVTGSADNSADRTEKEEKLEKARQTSNGAKPGSMTAKANMVKEFNERNSR